MGGQKGDSTVLLFTCTEKSEKGSDNFTLMEKSEAGKGWEGMVGKKN